MSSVDVLQLYFSRLHLLLKNVMYLVIKTVKGQYICNMFRHQFQKKLG